MFCRIHNVSKDFIVFHVPTAQRTPHDASVVPFPGCDAKNPAGAVIDFKSAAEFAPYAKDVSFFVRTGQVKLTLEDGTEIKRRDVRGFVAMALEEAQEAKRAADKGADEGDASEPEPKPAAKPSKPPKAPKAPKAA